MDTTRMCSSLLPALLLLATGAAAAASLDVADHETAATRKRPETDPLGRQLGAFALDASLGLGYEWNDNIFATDADEVDDNIILVRPEVLLASGWSRHSLRAGADATLARYGDYDDEDYDDYRIFADGRLDLARSNVTADVSYADLHERRTSPDDVGGTEPTTYSLTAANLSWSYRPGALLIRPDVRYRDFSFDDTPTASGRVDNSDRDRDVIDAGLRAGYEFSPEYVLFVEGRVSNVDYDRSVDFDGFQRSSDGYELVAGTTLDLGGKTFGEIYAGYRSWSFDDPRFSDIDGLSFGADVTWNITGLTTLTVSGERTIESTTIVNASGIERTALGLNVDHELLRNLLLWARVSTASEDFQGIDRDDDLLFAGLGAKYLMNRHLYLMVGFDKEKRDTSGSGSNGQEYDLNTIQVRLQGNL